MIEENADLNRQVELFLAAIRTEGARRVSDIQTKTEEETRAALEKAASAEQESAAKTANFESGRAVAQSNRRLSEGRAALRAALAEQRANIQADTFAAASQKLSAFTQSADYAPWLQESADRIAASLGSCTLYARSADCALFHAPQGCTVKADDTIVIGGLKAAGKTANADDTLETRLAAQRGWFLTHSGLSIDF